MRTFIVTALLAFAFVALGGCGYRNYRHSGNHGYGYQQVGHGGNHGGYGNRGNHGGYGGHGGHRSAPNCRY